MPAAEVGLLEDPGEDLGQHLVKLPEVLVGFGAGAGLQGVEVVVDYVVDATARRTSCSATVPVGAVWGSDGSRAGAGPTAVGAGLDPEPGAGSGAVRAGAGTAAGAFRRRR